MISSENIAQLTQHGLNYIVGARMGNLSAELLETVDKQIARQDDMSIRIKTELGDLICSYSSLRYRKDLYEMNKQIEKAKQAVETPSKTKKLKFTKTDKQQLALNQELIEKTKKLLGIKGYYTNLQERTASNQTIMERYHQLYKIEQAFRVSKSDLQTRPIFHFKEQPIKLHILICFMALVISKHIEIKAGVSIRKFLNDLIVIFEFLISSVKFTCSRGPSLSCLNTCIYMGLKLLLPRINCWFVWTVIEEDGNTNCSS
jgi:hypothetical protein